MRSLLVAIAATCFAWGSHAMEEPLREAASAIEATASDPSVTVTAIPMPASIVETLNPGAQPAKIRPLRKLKTARKKPLPNIMLTRTERQQMALLAPAPKAGGRPLLARLDDENNESTGYDDLPLHRSFARPRVFKAPWEEDGNAAEEMPPDVKLRLLMARLRAVDGHALAMAAASGDDGGGVPDNVRTRLFLARMKAVAAHQQKFS